MHVALSGGIATGKSTVGAALRRRGVPVVDADQLARDAVAPGGAGLDDVAAAFGAGVLAPDGSLDRAALGRIVFADPAARRILERIVHPRVRDGIARFFAGADESGLAAVAEIPLVYESAWQAAFDAVVVVACHPETQRRRLAERDGLSREAIALRLAAQWPIADKARLADFVILTDGSLADTERQAMRMADWLLAR